MKRYVISFRILDVTIKTSASKGQRQSSGGNIEKTKQRRKGTRAQSKIDYGAHFGQK